MKVQVTKEDIEDGHRCSSLYCPIANAMRRVTDRTVAVGSDDVYVEGLGDVLLPPEAADFVTAFDDGKAVEPFEFEIDFN